MYDIQVAHPLRQLLGGGRGEDIQLTCQLLTIQHLRDGTHLVDGQMGAAQDTEVRFSSAGRDLRSGLSQVFIRDGDQRGIFPP